MILKSQQNRIELVTRPGKYQAGDGPAVRWLVSKGVMVTVNPFFLSASVKEGVIQLILMTAAVLFIAVGTTLRNSLLAIPIVLTLLYAGIYIGHWVKISRTHGDLEDIDTSYSCHSKKGFWVAVLLSPEGKTNSITTDYTFITGMIGYFQVSPSQNRHPGFDFDYI